jgi:hypothetical protein
LGEILAEEKIQIFQQAHQIAWQNSSHHQELNTEVYDCQGSHITSTKINGCDKNLKIKKKKNWHQNTKGHKKLSL